MQSDLLTTEQLRLQVEKLHIQHIKLCQDNFLYFVQEVWPDFICRKEKQRSKWGHHQIIANEFTKISDNKKGRLPKVATITHAKEENKKVCLKFNLNSFSRLANINNIPINMVTNDAEIKL